MWSGGGRGLLTALWQHSTKLKNSELWIHLLPTHTDVIFVHVHYALQWSVGCLTRSLLLLAAAAACMAGI